MTTRPSGTALCGTTCTGPREKTCMASPLPIEGGQASLKIIRQMHQRHQRLPPTTQHPIFTPTDRQIIQPWLRLQTWDPGGFLQLQNLLQISSITLPRLQALITQTSQTIRILNACKLDNKRLCRCTAYPLQCLFSQESQAQLDLDHSYQAVVWAIFTPSTASKVAWVATNGIPILFIHHLESHILVMDPHKHQ